MGIGADEQKHKVAEAAYQGTDEGNSVTVEVRDILLDARNADKLSLNDSASLFDNVVFIDYNPNITTGQYEDDIADLENGGIGIYKDYGPKNEVYLAPGQGIAFNISRTYTRALLGIRSITGEPASVNIYSQDLLVDPMRDPVLKKQYPLTTATDMYYLLPDSQENILHNYCVVMNTSNTLVSITKLRVTFTPGIVVQSEPVVSIDGGLLNFVQGLGNMLKDALENPTDNNEDNLLIIPEKRPVLPERPSLTAYWEKLDISIKTYLGV